AASPMPASAMTPARSTSLFFAGRPSLAARNFRASIAAYSFFGMVKLSRTSFGFLALSAFSPLRAMAVSWSGALSALAGFAAFALTSTLAAGFAATFFLRGLATFATAFLAAGMGDSSGFVVK